MNFLILLRIPWIALFLSGKTGDLSELVIFSYIKATTTTVTKFISFRIFYLYVQKHIILKQINSNLLILTLGSARSLALWHFMQYNIPKSFQFNIKET